MKAATCGPLHRRDGIVFGRSKCQKCIIHKKMIRFLKNIKADSELEIKLTSFDFNAICYDIETYKYSNKSFYELVPIIYLQLKSLSDNIEHSNKLKSVDDNEYIFRNDSAKLNSLRNLISEIDSILLDLKKEVVI